MMNGTLCKTNQGYESLPDARATARIAPTIDDVLGMTPAPQDLFATAPMKVTLRGFDRQREEEAYTSFEAAISNRVLALKERHISANMGTGASGSIASALHILANTSTTIWHKVCPRRIWRRSLLLAGLALMFMLVGFDLMGLLVLYAR